jgi:hypothetical protein
MGDARGTLLFAKWLLPKSLFTLRQLDPDRRPGDGEANLMRCCIAPIAAANTPVSSSSG